jgi:diacylglycerol kinase (ATP)
MTSLAIVAHRRKQLGGGLKELREVLAAEGVDDPLWFEISKSRQAPRAARRAVHAGADLLLIWGGDGTVQRCVDATAGSGTVLAVLPAGTANLFASNLGIPTDLRGAVDVALRGTRRVLDTGICNGERFAVMAGAGVDAAMIRKADGRLKDRLGKIAYFWTGMKAVRRRAQRVRVKVDGKPWFKGKASCVLFGSMGTLTGGMVAFPDASPDDGQLEVGVVTADGMAQWSRLLARITTRRPQRSPFTHTTRARRVAVELARPTVYELDGGARRAVRRLQVRVDPGSITVCVPETSGV